MYTHPHPKRQQRDQRGIGAGLARVLSKMGYCSRKEAHTLIAAGRVWLNGVVRHDPEWRVGASDRIEVDGKPVQAAAKVYLLLNKPRGLVTTASDEQGRQTVFDCLAGHGLPFLGAVGRLDKASEGLLLLTNDTAWAARICDPASHIDKTYHVQVDRGADEALVQRLQLGLAIDGEFLKAMRARVLRGGKRNSWLEVVLDEGKNREIRRLLAALGLNVLRLVRVAIAGLPLGNLGKGEFRQLSASEVASLAPEMEPPKRPGPITAARLKKVLGEKTIPDRAMKAVMDQSRRTI
jgi:23S rRNA pseudouridine2605 synthase